MHSAKTNVPLTSDTMHIHMPPDLRWWGGWVRRSSSSVTAWDTQQVWMTWSIVLFGYHNYVTTSALSQWLSMIHISISAQYSILVRSIFYAWRLRPGLEALPRTRFIPLSRSAIRTVCTFNTLKLKYTYLQKPSSPVDIIKYLGSLAQF